MHNSKVYAGQNFAQILIAATTLWMYCSNAENERLY